jgi:hypothetical protein
VLALHGREWLAALDAADFPLWRVVGEHGVIPRSAIRVRALDRDRFPLLGCHAVRTIDAAADWHLTGADYG